MNIKTLLKEEKFSEREGVFYCIDVSNDIKPSRDENPFDKNQWSYWRRQNYDFFRNELKKYPDSNVVVDLGAGQSDFHDLTDRFNCCAADFYPYRHINVVCDITKILPFKDAVADIVILSNVLEHVPEPNTVLSECYRVLKPGGVLLASVPFIMEVHQRPYDFYRYTDINLEYLFKKHNFKSIVVHPVVMMYVLLFNAATAFFVSAIQKTKYSSTVLVQKAHTFLFRILWKLVRASFILCSPLFTKVAPDIDSPLGYVCKAHKQ